MQSSANKVSLRQLREEDAPVLSTLGNNPKISCNLRDMFPSPYHLEHAVGYINASQKGEFGHSWAICYDDETVGVISLIPQQDIYRHCAEIGYWIGEPFWGKGIATQAIAQTCDYAFNHLNIIRIYAGVFANNEASQKVLMKNNFELESIRAKGVIKDGQYIDEYFFVLLKP
jgi:[ribosomal protein S5]-alanine N-acetyltransferase